MIEFTEIRLGDYIVLITDYHANGSYENLKANVELKREDDFAIMVRTLNFERNDFSSDLIYLNEREYEFLEKSKVFPGDIVMNKIANPGNVYYMPDLKKPVSLAMNLFLIRFDDRVNQLFMYYLMHLQEDYIKLFTSGTTTKTITKDAVRGLMFRVPPKIHQDNIAKVLSDLDAKISLNNRINAELEDMAKLIYDYWFVQFDFPYDFAQGKPADETSNPKDVKPYKAGGGKMVYNEELKREIPEGWEVKELGDLVEIQRGISYTSKEISGGGIPMINLNSFKLDGTYKADGIKEYSGKYSLKNLASENDLLIAATDVTRNADIIGRAILVPGYYNELVFSMDIAKVIPVQSLTVEYLMMLFNSDHYHNYIKWYASGTLVLHLNMDGIKRYKAELPPNSLQLKFSELYQPIAERINQSTKENQELASLRDWLLPMLMNGQVKVKAGKSYSIEEGELGMVAEADNYNK